MNPGASLCPPVYAVIIDPHQFTYLLVSVALMLLGLPGYLFWSGRSS